MHNKPLALLATCVAILVATESVNAAASKLEKVFDPEMLSADLAYFEQVTGPARSTLGNQKIYKVDGCEVTATVSGGAISALHMPLNNKCSFDLNKFFSNAQPALPLTNLTVGQFDKSMGSNGVFLSDCLTMCGNAADPSVYEYWEGSHAVGYLNVLLEVALVSDQAIAASDQWRDAMIAGKGEDWVMDTKFNCEPNSHNDTARKAFERVKVSAITIGGNLVKPGC